MSESIKPMEGTWEEIQKQAPKLAGRRVRVEILPEKGKSRRRVTRFNAVDRKTEKFLEEFAGSWAGDDLDECLKLVYKTRTPTEDR